MLHKAKSKDDIPTGKPTFMSSEQMTDYFQGLRSNRIQRPNGSRPPPSKFGSFSSRVTSRIAEIRTPSPTSDPTFQPAEVGTAPPTRSSSALSHHRTASAMSNRSGEQSMIGRPLVQPPKARDSSAAPDGRRTPSITYKEDGRSMVEREEARALRLAMEEMDLKDEERLYDAARDEAVDLVWKHQNPNVPHQNPDAPYPYPENRHQRTQSLGRGDQDLQRANSRLRKRHSYSSSTTGSRSSSLQSDRTPSNPLRPEQEAAEKVVDNVRGRQGPMVEKNKSDTSALPDFKHRRRSSGSSRRNLSGSLFINPKDQIYEEPEEETTTKPAAVPPPKGPAKMPLQVRRNPFSRVQFAKEGLARANTDPLMGMKRFDRVEIQNNPPSQSRNAQYTANSLPDSRPTSEDKPETVEDEDSEVKMKDGKEVRGDDIRAATSMRLKDRSAKLPTPTIVSDSPGRPIVSFQNDWKPKEVELKQEISALPPAAPKPLDTSTRGPRPLTKAPTEPIVPTLNNHDQGIRKDTAARVSATSQGNNSPRPLPSISINAPAPPRINVSPAPVPSIGVTPPIPSINVSEPAPAKSPAIPSISISPTALAKRPSIPSINVSAAPSPRNPPIPSISVQETPSITINADPVPTINAPAISVSAPPVPTINEPSSGRRGSTRPLPTPRSAPGKTFARASAGVTPVSRPHWTPAARRTTALCQQCALPIAGRIVSAASCRFHPECFVCHHCGEGLECVAFYPEPDNKHAERVDRIRRRMNGEDVEIIEGASEIDDGDESMRFYCHLDFHELFSPRCKSCKTPIEGEVIVACGAEWHAGHFFCAQCGDPFDSSTPFVEKDGYAWCVGCHTNRYSTKCKKCRKPVTDTVVKALGAEWHMQCFCCMECSGPFEDGRYFLRGDSDDPVCVRCEERRLKA